MSPATLLGRGKRSPEKLRGSTDHKAVCGRLGPGFRGLTTYLASFHFSWGAARLWASHPLPIRPSSPCSFGLGHLTPLPELGGVSCDSFPFVAWLMHPLQFPSAHLRFHMAKARNAVPAASPPGSLRLFRFLRQKVINKKGFAGICSGLVFQRALPSLSSLQQSHLPTAICGRFATAT